MPANSKIENQKYWIVVVSKDHIEIGKKLGIVQACHGKLAPMKRMKPGDMIIFYSPKLNFQDTESLKRFTAIARIKDGEPYESSLGTGFKAFRRDVKFLPAKEGEILPLVPRLSFIKNKKSWGFIFRFGLFEIQKEDFEIISKEMCLK